MKLRTLFFPMLWALSLLADTVEVPASVYAPDSPVNGDEGMLVLELPEGWKYTEHNGAHYLIGGSDVYGSVSLAYNRMGIMNYTSQFGTPTPPKSEIDGVTVYHQVKNDSGSFLRKLGTTGWSIRASLQPYPKFKGKDLSDYEQQFVTMLATAKADTPDVPDGE